MKQAAPTADLARKHAFKVLADSFETFYGNAIAIDTAHKITWISDGYRKFLGIDHDPAGQPITRYIQNSYLPKVADTGEPILLDLLWLQKRWILVSVIPLQSDQGEIIGAFGFVALDNQKEFSSLTNRVNQLQQQLDCVTSQLNQARKNKYGLSHISGRSEQLLAIKNQVRQAARFDISVLITGETGTGKELFAHALHDLSSRSDKPFISLNVAAIPDNLIEAEFFGVAPGAYTGASKQGRKGKLELANTGTLFLDEIGDMPLEVQGKLLRVLQEKEFEAVGSDTIKKTDIRIVAATSRNLVKMIENGEFRADLYYRLNGMPIHLPPLRQRLDDIDLIAERILDETCARLNIAPKYLSAGALPVLRSYQWPGNVRELQNVLERAVIMAEDHVEISAQLLTGLLHNGQGTVSIPSSAEPVPEIQPQLSADTSAIVQQANRSSLPPIPLSQQLAEAEKAAIKQAIHYTCGHKAKAAEALGISRATLYEKMKKLGI